MAGLDRIGQRRREAGQAHYEFDVLAGGNKIFPPFGTTGNVSTQSCRRTHGIGKLKWPGHDTANSRPA